MGAKKSRSKKVVLEKYSDDDSAVRPATMPWWLAAVGGALVCIVAGWAVIAALVLVAQVAEEGVVLGSALHFATQVWLLSHGGIFELGITRITLVPLGYTAILALLIHGAASYAGKQAELSGGPDMQRGYAVAKVTGVMMAVYGAVVTVAAFVIDLSTVRAGLGAIVLAGGIGFFGARKAIDWNPHQRWPVWARALPRAAVAGVLIALVGGVVVLVSGLIANREQFVMMTNQLNPGWAGGIVLALIQAFYALNVVIWCVSWSFGPGFTLGDGSVISLMGSHAGLLPAFPITAALPSQPGSLLWLAFPIAAGIGAAFTVLRARPRARFDETALVGGLAGVTGGIGVAGLAAMTSGDLGIERLTGLGPFVVPLLVIAPCLMGLSGMFAGFVLGLVRRPTTETDHRWWSRWGTESGKETEKPRNMGKRGIAAPDSPTVLIKKTPASKGAETNGEKSVTNGDKKVKSPDGVNEASGDAKKPTSAKKASDDSQTVSITEKLNQSARKPDKPKEEPTVSRSWLAPIFRKAKTKKPAGASNESPAQENSEATARIQPVVAEQPTLNFHPDE
ncbi:MAG: DUF6350 family protein [Propionibacteriaceae bacterium]|nr:DUF6350 family protein [Propionibacteriaceae bacterium]